MYRNMARKSSLFDWLDDVNNELLADEMKQIKLTDNYGKANDQKKKAEEKAFLHNKNDIDENLQGAEMLMKNGAVPINTIQNDGTADGRFSNACIFISIRDYLHYVHNVRTTVTQLRQEAKFPGKHNEMFDTNIHNHLSGLETMLRNRRLCVRIFYVPTFRIMKANGRWENKIFNGYATSFFQDYGDKRVGSDRIINIICNGWHFELITTAIQRIDYSAIEAVASGGGRMIRRYEPAYVSLTGSGMRPRIPTKPITTTDQPTLEEQFQILQERYATITFENVSYANELENLRLSYELNNQELKDISKRKEERTKILKNLRSRLADYQTMMTMREVSTEQKKMMENESRAVVKSIEATSKSINEFNNLEEKGLQINTNCQSNISRINMQMSLNQSTIRDVVAMINVMYESGVKVKQIGGNNNSAYGEIISLRSALKRTVDMDNDNMVLYEFFKKLKDEE
jgi:hypothetical protein